MRISASNGLLGKAWESLAHKGPLGLARDVRDYVRWRATMADEKPPAAVPVPQTNWDLNQEELRGLPDVLRSKPILVYAEASTRCNLHCFMCRLSFPETTRRTREHMRLETFAGIEPLLEPESRLSLFGLGEPLLNPNFVEMLRMAKGRGAFVGLNSNCMLLTERVARAMVECGQDLLVVSFSGGTKETYERVITGASYERVLANLRRLNELKREKASEGVPLEQVRPVLQLQFTAMRDNIQELPEAVRLAVDLRCAGAVAMPLTVVDPSLAEQSILGPELHAQVESAFQAAREVAASAGYSFDLQLPAVSGQHSAPSTQDSSLITHHSSLCHEPWQTLYVRDDGMVNTCCYSNRVLGDLKQQTALEIWNGDLYRRFRARMRADNKPAECRVCHKLRGDDWYDQRVDEAAFYDEL